MFTQSVRKDYIQKMLDGKKPSPPEIVFEAFFDFDSNYKGTNNSLAEDSAGIQIIAHVAEKNLEIYKQMIAKGEIKDIPIELYTVDCCFFSGESFDCRDIPMFRLMNGVSTGHRCPMLQVRLTMLQCGLGFHIQLFQGQPHIFSLT